jgi:hypothetical protein
MTNAGAGRDRERITMPKRSTDAALDKIRELHAKWLAGTLASEDALFQISDVIQTHDAAARTKVKPALVTA